MGFAKKSTRAFAIKSSHMRVKPRDAAPGNSGQEMMATHGRKCTRSLFNGEKACYLIDAKQEGNLARFINVRGKQESHNMLSSKLLCVVNPFGLIIDIMQ